MNKKIIYFTSFIFIMGLLLFQPIKAQTQQEKVPLTQVLNRVEKKFKFKFSYADKDLQKIKIIPPDETLSFNQTISYIQKETNLIFQALSNQQIAIQKPRKNKKNETEFEPVQELEEVMLTDYLAKGISKKNNGVFEIDYQQFGILPGLIEPDALQTLQALPGVESVNETTSNINVRGGTFDQNLVLWDDIRMYQTGHFFGLISAFNPYQTKEVSLIKNGTNPIFGNSVSSVISMRTEKELNDEFYAETGINYLSIDGLVDTPISKKSSIQVAARTSISNVFRTPTYNQYYERAFQDSEITANPSNVITTDDNFSFYDISLRWLYHISEKDKLRANFIYLSNDLEFTENAIINDSIESRESNLSQNSLGVGLFYEREWNKNFKTSAQYYTSAYQLSALNSDVINSQRIIQENEVIENTVKVSGNLKLLPSVNLLGGYEFSEIGISNLQEINFPYVRTYGKEFLRTHSVFSSLHYKSANKKTALAAGARVNYFEKFNLTLAEPRLSFNQRFLDYFTLEILGEIKSQSTTQVIDFQTDFLGIEKRRWQLANQEDIPVLKSNQLSLGLHYTQNNWLISAEAYSKNVSGITSQSQGFQNQYQYAQIIGDYQVRGIDMLVNKKFNNFSVWASYSFTDNNYNFPNLAQNEFANNVEIVNSFSMAGSYSINNFKVSAGLNWRDGKPFTPISPNGLSTNQFDYEASNLQNLPRYLRADISASQKFELNPKLNAYAGISVWNLFDNKNIINAYYELNNQNNISLVQQPALGITPNFVFRLMF